ncbi:tubulin [Holotrichia oblita]|uniref:Tubulin n=2 Tax=Holotrichia oblita TaxID=644536 RepID=A0ACB9SYH4_HOLOL|nr:tubulin [Holotrichia oblita]
MSQLTLFEDIKKCEVKARAILVDMETSVILRYKTGSLQDLFDDTCIITHYPGSGNNWAEGHCHYGPMFENTILTSIKKAVEKCDSLHGFLLMFSTGGGTGSGLGTYILKLLEDNYPNIDRFVICVYPTGTEDVITCPYNMALATKELIKHASCVVPVENRALLDIVNRQANNKHSIDTMNFIAKCKPFQDMNSIIVNLLLNLTSGSRFSGSLNVDLNEISTNMVPFPNLQFLAAGLSPLTVSSDLVKSNKQIREEIFLQTLQKNNQLLKINVTGPKSIILGTTLIGRGDFNISDMRTYIQRLQKKTCFTSWSARAMKIGLCDVPPIGHHAAMLSLFNTTSMSTLLKNVNSQLMRLYNRKAHTHHYLQVPGFEDYFFEECSEIITNSIQSYRDIEELKPFGMPRLTPVGSDISL